MSASANNTTVTPNFITDSIGGTWSISAPGPSGAQVVHNGVVDTSTSNVSLLLYENSTVYQQNTAGTFYTSLNSVWVAVFGDPRTNAVSANNTAVTTAGPAIVTVIGEKWTLVQSSTASVGMQIAVNGTIDSVTHLVTTLLYYGGNIYQENSSGSWYYKTKSSDANWTVTSDPRATSPTTTPTTTTITAPSQASAAGFSKLAFDDEFDDPTSIAPNSTASGKYKWWMVAQTQTSDFSVANSVLTIKTDHTGYSADFSTVPANAAASLRNGVWQHAYFEARIAFNPKGFTGSGAWPAFWSWAMEAASPQNGQQTAELDFMEFYPASQAGGGGSYITTIHNWNNTSSGATNGGGSQSSPNMPNQQPADSNFHIYGCLWTQNKVQFYFDNVLCTYSGGVTSLATGPGTSLPALENNHMSLTLGTGTNWPMQVDWVRVWSQ